MENLTWEGNSKEMYDRIIEVLPPLFKAAVKKKVSVWIDKYNIETITEKDVVETIKKLAPEGYKDKLLSLVTELETE